MNASNCLTPHEQMFEIWLKTNIPYLVKLWDFSEARYKKEEVDDYLAICSSGQALMCCFAIQVWTGGLAGYPFDLFKAIRTLDDNDIKILQDWIKDPWCC